MLVGRGRVCWEKIMHGSRGGGLVLGRSSRSRKGLIDGVWLMVVSVTVKSE